MVWGLFWTGCQSSLTDRDVNLHLHLFFGPSFEPDQFYCIQTLPSGLKSPCTTTARRAMEGASSRRGEANPSSLRRESLRAAASSG